MFVIDTTSSGGGSQGPWMRWTSEGSARKRLEPESWALREKDEYGNAVETNVPAFKNGCVLDLDSLKLGWERETGPNSMPERRWSASVAKVDPRPDESKKASGSFAWSQALSVRCAIGGGKAATWEQSGFGAYEAFMRVARQIQAEWPTHSQNGTLLPLIVQTGVDHIKLKSGSSAVPVLSVSKWVPRPDCLKDGAPAAFAVGGDDAPPQRPAQQPAAQPAPAANIPSDAAF